MIIVRQLMHKNCRNLHFLIEIFRYDFLIGISFGYCFQQGAQKFEVGKTYFWPSQDPYLNMGLQNFSKFEATSELGVAPWMTKHIDVRFFANARRVPRDDIGKKFFISSHQKWSKNLIFTKKVPKYWKIDKNIPKTPHELIFTPQKPSVSAIWT